MATIYAKGGRKRATSRVYLSTKKGETTIHVNKTPLTDYFTKQLDITTVQRPLQLLSQTEEIDSKQAYQIASFVKGGGTTGQAEAIAQGIAQAIAQIGDPHKIIIDSENLRTRDGRKKERKKPGRIKARKRKQWTKR